MVPISPAAHKAATSRRKVRLTEPRRDRKAGRKAEIYVRRAAIRNGTAPTRIKAPPAAYHGVGSKESQDEKIELQPRSMTP
jgi:hypothetical protein